MGFSSFHNSSPNPAQRYYRWSGGEKKVTLDDGSTVKKLNAQLVYWDGEVMQSQELPFVFCALEQTSSVTGFAPKANGDIRYYSNEITSFDEPIKVTRRDSNGSEVIVEGIYQNVKKNLPEGCKFQTNLYIYNPAEQRIERINLKGSALSEWITFGQKNKGIYEHTITMEAGEQKTTGTNDYIVPKYTLGDKYTDEDMRVLSEQDAIVVEYLKGKREANLKGAGEADFGGEGGSIDQTPAQYEGEQSQEAAASDDSITLDEVPF